MERLDKIIVCETDKGNYAVRPLNWAGYWDKDGKIKECGLNHIAVFHYKEDAEWYAETKNAEEQGLLLRLPVAIGGTIYHFEYPTRIDDKGIEWSILDKKRVTIKPMKFALCHLNGIGRLYFLTKEEAEQALANMQKA